VIAAFLLIEAVIVVAVPSHLPTPFRALAAVTNAFAIAVLLVLARQKSP